MFYGWPVPPEVKGLKIPDDIRFQMCPHCGTHDKTIERGQDGTMYLFHECKPTIVNGWSKSTRQTTIASANWEDLARTWNVRFKDRKKRANPPASPA